jgi:hypothetical protein
MIGHRNAEGQPSVPPRCVASNRLHGEIPPQGWLDPERFGYQRPFILNNGVDRESCASAGPISSAFNAGPATQN